MILDSSVIIAVILREAGYERLVSTMAAAEVLAVGVATLAETGIVLTARMGPTATDVLLRFIGDFEVDEIAFDAHHWRLAVDAFERFGKGRHPASLNFGDCLSYAIAAASDEPILCVGDDFPQTDLRIADLDAA